MTEATQASEKQATVKVPHERAKPGTYVGDEFEGDPTANSGGAPTLAPDGEPAGLARVTLAMRPPEKQSPAPGRLVALCSWATAIGIAGLLLAARSGIALLSNPPGWFLPTAGATGLVGVAATGAAFFTARQRIVPWALLGLATGCLGIAVVLVSLLADPAPVSSIP